METRADAEKEARNALTASINTMNTTLQNLDKNMARSNTISNLLWPVVAALIGVLGFILGNKI